MRPSSPVTTGQSPPFSLEERPHRRRRRRRRRRSTTQASPAASWRSLNCDQLGVLLRGTARTRWRRSSRPPTGPASRSRSKSVAVDGGRPRRAAPPRRPAGCRPAVLVAGSRVASTPTRSSRTTADGDGDEQGRARGCRRGDRRRSRSASAASIGALTATRPASALARRRPVVVVAGPSSTGADTGSVGRRRRPGKAARTVPSAITPPPIQSQITSGWTMTRTMTGVVVGSSGSAEQREVHVVGEPGAHRRRADGLRSPSRERLSAGS